MTWRYWNTLPHIGYTSPVTGQGEKYYKNEKRKTSNVKCFREHTLRGIESHVGEHKVKLVKVV